MGRCAILVDPLTVDNSVSEVCTVSVSLAQTMFC